MPLRLDIKRKLTARSDRVKCVDLHPTEPWMLASLYNGNVHVWNHESQQLVKSFEVCDLPVRAAVFVPRKNWIVTGSDDMQVRVFNYNTLERAHAFEAHSDYVRCIVVHPTQPYILTSSDDMLIKLWNWEKQWVCQQVFEGHTHYVMQIVINTKDNNTLASASLDRTVKVWQLGSPTPNFTLEGHEKGVNCVDYYHGGDKPYLISGADDRMVKIWDYQNKTCVQTLEGHAANISAVCFHPELPIVLTGSEDGTVRIWHSGTYRLESSLNYGFERVWTIACMRGSNNVAIGYDEGSIMVKVGREEPAVSMDVNGEKIVWARHSEIQQANLKAMPEGIEIKDGERLPVAVKDMGSCEIYPQTIAHNPNGRFVVVCGDGEYIIYTAMALRNKAFGSAHEFVWAQDSSEYAVREGTTTVKVFKNFKEKKSFRPEFGAEGIFGGFLLGVRSASGLALYDWEHLELVRRIEIQPKHVFWSESGELVALATEDSYFVLRYDANAVLAAREQGGDAVTQDGVEEAFDVLGEVHVSVRTGLWVGDCFIYTNSVNRINYYMGGEIVTVSVVLLSQVLGEIHESVRTGLWVGDCFIYTNSVNRINYYVGGEIVTVSVVLLSQVLGEVHESVRTGLWVGDCFIYTNSVNRTNYYVGGEIVTVSVVLLSQVLGEVHESVRTGLWVGDCFIYTNSVNRINYYVGGEIVTVSVVLLSQVLGEVHESVRTGLWVGDCFIYTNSVNRINYYVGGEIVTVSHLDRTMYLLGYVAKDNRLYLGDKELNIVSYSLLLSVLEYQTAVMRGDFETADKVLPTVPTQYRTRVAHFLEKQGFKQQALAVSTDPEHRFELALQLGELQIATTLAREAGHTQKWRQLAELATNRGQLQLAQECLHQAQDFGGLLLLATSAGNADMVRKLGDSAEATGKNNVAFLSFMLLGELEKCLQILIDTDRLPEAAFFARTYLPSQMSRVVALWRESLSKVSEKAGQSLADPKDYENLFPGLQDSLKTEQYLQPERRSLLPASAYPNIPANHDRNPVAEMKEAEANGRFHYVPPGASAEDEALSFGGKGDDDRFSRGIVDPVMMSSPAGEFTVPSKVTPTQPPTVGSQPPAGANQPPARAPAPNPPASAHQDDDDLELDLDNMNLDDIDTSFDSWLESNEAESTSDEIFATDAASSVDVNKLDLIKAPTKENEIELDLDNMNFDKIDASDINLEDEDLMD